MGVENGIFWSEIGSGFGDAGGRRPPKISRSTPPPPPRGPGMVGKGMVYMRRMELYFSASEIS